MLSSRQNRVLSALLIEPSLTKVSEITGISTRTIHNYVKMPEFQEEYQKRITGVIQEATRQMQLSLSPAITALKNIVDDDAESANVRVASARVILDYCLRLTEITDILRRIESIEQNIEKR